MLQCNKRHPRIVAASNFTTWVIVAVVFNQVNTYGIQSGYMVCDNQNPDRQLFQLYTVDGFDGH